jgi:hypothetical protein
MSLLDLLVPRHVQVQEGQEKPHSGNPRHSPSHLMVCIAWVEVWCLCIVDDAGEQTESVDSQECELRWDG